MNWIKITPETILPEVSDLLLLHPMGYYELGSNYDGKFGTEGGGKLHEFTHYAIITPPEEESDTFTYTPLDYTEQ